MFGGDIDSGLLFLDLQITVNRNDLIENIWDLSLPAIVGRKLGELARRKSDALGAKFPLIRGDGRPDMSYMDDDCLSEPFTATRKVEILCLHSYGGKKCRCYSKY